MKFDVVVTRHKALLDYVIMRAMADKDTPLIEHATPDDIRGKDVLGVLPLHLAQHAKTVTDLQLDVPPELRGKELSLEQVKLYGRGFFTYTVHRVR